MDFRGTTNSEIYLISFSSTDIFPMSGKKGEFVTSFLGSYNLIDKTRIANLKYQSKDSVYDDINSSSPKVIVAFGDEAVSYFTNSKRQAKNITGVNKIKILGHTYKLIILEDPEELIQDLTNKDRVLTFAKGLFTASRIIDGTYVDILESKEVLNAHSFEEFKNIYETRFSNDAQVSYDIETNARPPLFRGSKIIGFSISNKTSGVYVSVDSLEWHMPEEEENKIWDYLINEIFEKKKLIIHNTMYERPYTLYCKHYEIGFDKADDTLVMARLLRNPKDSAGLKYQAQTNLEYPDWETNLNDYISSIRFFIDRIGMGPDKFKPLYSLINRGTSIFKLKGSPEYLKLKDDDKNEVGDVIDLLYSMLIDMYSDEEIDNLGILISEKIAATVNRGGIQDSTIPYNWIPDRILSQYGAVDALATYDLKDYFFKLMEVNSTDKVDLHVGYHNWLEHIYVAYIMERNGLYWDEESADRDKQLLLKKALESIKFLLTSPCFEPHIIKSSEAKYRPILLSDYYPAIANCQGYDVSYDRITDKYTVKYQGKRVTKDKLFSIVIPDSYKDEYERKIKEFFYEEVESLTDIEELKKLFNPTSSEEATPIAKAIFMSPDLMVSGKIMKLHLLSTSGTFKSDTLTAIEKKFLDLASWCYDESKLKESFPDNWVAVRKQFFEGFKNLLKSYKKEVTNPEIKKILSERESVKIDTFNDEGVITVYDSLLIQGINQDDESTWTEEFRWLINFRLFKKYLKLVTSYIDGVVGHESVYVINKNDIGKPCTERIRPFSEGVCSDNEAYLMNASWHPNTAETGRWRSAQHTVPAGSQIKKYYISRFKGGTMLMPDYSQMEVRALAAISHDENMLELFRSGKDFHTETAKKIFRKEEVSPAERRFSKGATFSLLYGSSVKSFAKAYCDGDETYAQSIFDGFFEAYPRVQEWVEERHKEAEKTGQVSLELAGRIIKLDKNDMSGGLLRKAQNYPIQGTSADLTGCVVWDIQKFFEDTGLKSLIVMYVHDSIEVDVPPFELIKVVTNLKKILVESPLARMGLPARADVALGYSLGHEIDMEDIQVVTDDLTECVMHLKGYKDEIDDTVNNWKQVYSVVETLDENYKEEPGTLGELFIPKKAYSSMIGVSRQKGTCKVHIKY